MEPRDEIPPAAAPSHWPIEVLAAIFAATLAVINLLAMLPVAMRGIPGVFKDLGGDVPGWPIVLLDFATVLASRWWIVLFGTLLLLFGIGRFLRTRAGDRFRAQFRRKLFIIVTGGLLLGYVAILVLAGIAIFGSADTVK